MFKRDSELQSCPRVKFSCKQTDSEFSSMSISADRRFGTRKASVFPNPPQTLCQDPEFHNSRALRLVCIQDKLWGKVRGEGRESEMLRPDGERWDLRRAAGIIGVESCSPVEEPEGTRGSVLIHVVKRNPNVSGRPSNMQTCFLSQLLLNELHAAFCREAFKGNTRTLPAIAKTLSGITRCLT